MSPASPTVPQWAARRRDQLLVAVVPVTPSPGEPEVLVMQGGDMLDDEVPERQVGAAVEVVGVVVAAPVLALGELVVVDEGAGVLGLEPRKRDPPWDVPERTTIARGLAGEYLGGSDPADGQQRRQQRGGSERRSPTPHRAIAERGAGWCQLYSGGGAPRVASAGRQWRGLGSLDAMAAGRSPSAAVPGAVEAPRIWAQPACAASALRARAVRRRCSVRRRFALYAALRRWR